MKKFEVGKIYGENAVKYEILKRTAKTVTYIRIFHLGRFNEKRTEPAKAKIFDWTTREVFFRHDETIEA